MADTDLPAPTPDTEKPRRHRFDLPSLTARRSDVGERIVETLIYGIAGLSILFIFLILFFVVREAAPIVLGSDEEPAVAATAPPASTTASPPDGADTGSDPDIIAYNPESDDTVASTPDQADSGQTAIAAPVDSAQLPPVTTTAQDELAARIREKGGAVLERSSPVRLNYLLFDEWQPNSEHPRYGIYPILIGTAKSTLIALLIATPLGIFAAIYTAFFARPRVREVIKPVVELLAGFPSVVIGFLCLMTIATVVQAIFGNEARLNAVVGGIGLAFAVIPIIYTITDDALRAVPTSLREAALAVGASEWQAAYQIMLPAATPGIIAAILLGLGRAFGETMIALMAMGNAQTMSWNFFDSVRTLAATIGAEMGEVEHGSPHYQVLFFLGVILFVFSFGLNLVTEFWVKDRLIRRFRGSE